MSESKGPVGAETPVIEQKVEVDRDKLRFLRWLAEHGRLEREVFGPPSGEYAEGE